MFSFILLFSGDTTNNTFLDSCMCESVTCLQMHSASINVSVRNKKRHVYTLLYKAALVIRFH